jgi:hypothetical protein
MKLHTQTQDTVSDHPGALLRLTAPRQNILLIEQKEQNEEKKESRSRTHWGYHACLAQWRFSRARSFRNTSKENDDVPMSLRAWYLGPRVRTKETYKVVAP